MVNRRSKGEGAFYQKKDGKWVATIEMGLVDGKRKRRTFEASTRAEAARKLKMFEAERVYATQLAPQNLTVEQYVKTWLEVRIPDTIAERTVEVYERNMRLYILPKLGKIELQQLTPNDVSQMLNSLTARGLSANTRRLARATLKRALRVAEQDGLLQRNVAAIADGPKLPQSEGQSMTIEQAQLFLDACKSHRLGVAYSIALLLGLRRGEVIGLKWTDIEIDGDLTTLRVQRQLVRFNKTGVRLTDLKTKGSRRTLLLSSPIVALLSEHSERQRVEATYRGTSWSNDAELIFTSTFGTPLDPEDFGRGVTRIAKGAGLGHWTLHGLRHTCASLLIEAKVPLDQVSDQLGHASINVTKDVYIHRLKGSGERAALAIATLLYGHDESSEITQENALASPLARPRLANDAFTPMTRNLVGRPGLDPGTLRLKVSCSSR